MARRECHRTSDLVSKWLGDKSPKQIKKIAHECIMRLRECDELWVRVETDGDTENDDIEVYWSSCGEELGT